MPRVSATWPYESSPHGITAAHASVQRVRSDGEGMAPMESSTKPTVSQLAPSGLAYATRIACMPASSATDPKVRYCMSVPGLSTTSTSSTHSFAGPSDSMYSVCMRR